jgi:NAD(P)-dependent dehydrogenase (short-subunit alcohol dehydrogenase family)
MFPTPEPALCLRPGQAKLTASQRAASRSQGLIRASAVRRQSLSPAKAPISPWITCRAKKPDAQEVIALIETAGRKAVALAGDIRDEGFCSQLVADSLAALGGLDLLVNVAEHQQARESIADITTEQFDETFKTNVYAMFWLCKAALPHMSAGAAIINSLMTDA